MKKRIASLTLAVVILISMMSLAVSAETVMTTSDQAVAMLKEEEGFSSKPYWDYAQWTIGYGTKCPDDMLEYYKQHGIQEQEAESLLRTYLTRFESELHKFMERTGVKLTQNQFDALLLFTYNCGSGWSYDTTGIFYNAIVNGATGNDLIYAFSRWCSAGGQILTTLLRRRLCEANMYLNGVYSQVMPEEYGYVLYDACGGKTSPTVQGYDVTLTAPILSEPTYEGHTFGGWFTAETGGTEVKVLDASVRNTRLYAHWIDEEGKDISQGIQGITITVTATGVNIRSGAGTNHSVVGTANKGDQFVITETAEGTDLTWGKFSTGWICLDFTNYKTAVEEQQKPETDTEQPPETDVEQPPETDVEQPPETDTEQPPETDTEQPPETDTEQPPETDTEQPPETDTEQKPEDGKDEATENNQPDKPEEPEEKPEPAPKTQMGTVRVNDELRIRSGPSTGYPVEGYLKNGDRVEILEQQIAGSMVWGRIDKGWISLSYVTLDKEQDSEDAPNIPDNTDKIVATGTVNVNDLLRIRTGPGTSYALVDYLTKGARVEILEMKVSGSMTWGKIDKGWISLDYVTLDKNAQETPKKVTGTVKVSDLLRVRSGAGMSYSIVGYLTNDTKVEILEQKTVSGMLWGKIEKGWISLDYVILDGQNTAPTVIKKTVIADCLNVRSGAGTSYSIVGYLYTDAKVEILETKTVGSDQWGRIANGWISMLYVK